MSRRREDMLKLWSSIKALDFLEEEVPPPPPRDLDLDGLGVNKFVPPEINLSERRQRTMDHRLRVRMTLPISIRCNTCGKCYAKGTQFSSLEDVLESGARLHKLKCSKCSAEFLVQTYSRNSDGIVDGIVDSGATLLFDESRPRAEED